MENHSVAPGPFSSSLDEKRPQRRWRVRVCEAGEATVQVEAPPVVKAGSHAWSWAREVENRERAGRRARGQMRRYGVHNMLRYMWTLTYAGAGEYDHRAAMRHTRLFVRRLQRVHGLQAYQYAPEPHPEGHGWHINVFVAVRLPHASVERLWGRGFVWVKDWGRERRYGSLRERIRAAAGYGAKYAGKDVQELARYGCHIGQQEHRYEVARGHRPRWTEARVASEVDALAWIATAHGRILRVVACDATVGGGLWVRFTPHASPDPPT